ncbi:MAG: GrpB family protein [Brevundimonas sp.]|nr:GrpB family protein [Brevundimonas sp.]MDO9587359.1 GrpB family protein [Brevundimonas sp.]
MAHAPARRAHALDLALARTGRGADRGAAGGRARGFCGRASCRLDRRAGADGQAGDRSARRDRRSGDDRGGAVCAGRVGAGGAGLALARREWRGRAALFHPGRSGDGARDGHLHVYAAGDPALAWHVAFRDRLRAEPATAAAYEREKSRCAALHPDDSGAYAACKKAWTDGVAAEAVRGWGGSG